MGELEGLPATLLVAILDRLDAATLCSVAATCRLLRVCSAEALPRLPCVNLLDISPPVQVVRRLLACNTTVKSLKLDCFHLNDAALIYILKPQLQMLSLQSCDKLSTKLLVEIGRHCRSLRSLSLDLGWRYGKGHSLGLELLLEGCSLLECLSLRSERSCFDLEALGAIIISGTLKVLDIGYVAERDIKQIFKLHEHGHNLQPSIISLNDGFKNLQKLSLVLDRITDSLVTAICQALPCLTDLVLCDEPAEEPLLAFDLTNSGIQQIGACRWLRCLSLIRSRDLYPAYFKRVNDLGILLMVEYYINLESIHLGGFSRLTDAGCRAVLHSCPNLHTFQILDMVQVTDLVFHDLSATSLSLQSVGLASCFLISDYSVARLVACKNLQTLNLHGCRSVGDKGLQSISTLCHLKVLSLGYADISDDGLCWLGKGTTPLISLSIRGCQRVTDEGISWLLDGHLAETLKALDLSATSGLTYYGILALVQSGFQPVELTLRYCPHITDKSLKLLAGGTFGERLQMLDICYCRVTACSWMSFQKPHFPKLRWLGLNCDVWRCLAKSLAEPRPSITVCIDGFEFSNSPSSDFVVANFGISPRICTADGQELHRNINMISNTYKCITDFALPARLS